MSVLDFIPRIEKEIQRHIDWAQEWSSYQISRKTARELVWNFWLFSNQDTSFSNAYHKFLKKEASNGR